MIDPTQTYLLLSADGVATPLPGGMTFWSRPPAELDRIGEGWLVTEFEFTADWPNWEMHPRADEFVYLLSGAVTLHLEHVGGITAVPLNGRGAAVIPKGVWHTATVHAPSRMLFLTLGAGTQHRPLDDA